MRKIIKIFALSVLVASYSYAIVPPAVPEAKIPKAFLENLKKDPNYYMPGDGYTKQIEAYKEARRNGTKASKPYAYVPVLLCQYGDLPQPEWPAVNMANQLFDKEAEWPTGSMRKYYDEASYGRFELDGEIVSGDWVKMDEPSSYWNTEKDFGRDAEMAQELIRQAVSKIDSVVDFSKFDLDADGRVDHLILVHSGVGGESGGPEIWSHSSAFWGNPLATDDGVDIYGYVVQPAMTTTNEMEGIEVYVHEFGHALGLPDLYDRDDEPDEESSGVGEWCIMASNTAHDESPVHFSAWCKEVLGWVDPIMVEGNLYDLEVLPVEGSGTVYKLWTKGQVDPYTYGRGVIQEDVGREYFLIENRQKLLFDRELPSAGMLIWHIRNDVTTQNDDQNAKLVDLEAADNRLDLDAGRNNGDEGDPFPGSRNNRFFNRISYPSSESFYGDISRVAVENIEQVDTLIYADILSYAPDLEYVENMINDASGDANHFADPGETVDIHLKFRNYGPEMAKLNLTLRSDDPDVEILDSTAVLTNIVEDTVYVGSGDVFSVKLADSAAYHPVRAVVSATDGDRVEFEYEMVIMMENLKILIVDAAGESSENGLNIVGYYERALSDAGIPYYDTWDVAQNGDPAAADLADYRTLVWVSGQRFEPFDASRKALLTDFLVEGRSLFLSGQNIGESMVQYGTEEDSTFYADVLRAKYTADGPGFLNVLATGIEKDPVSHPFRPYFFLNGGNSENNQISPDIIGTLNGSVPSIDYFGTGLMGKQAAIRYEDEDYKLFYMAFGLEGVNELGTANITRSELMQRGITWLQQNAELSPTSIEEADLPSEFVLGANYPNPFNATTLIPLRIAEAGNYVFAVYDLQGRLVDRRQMNFERAAAYEINWSGMASDGRMLPSGIYIYRISDEKGMSRSAKMLLLK